MSTVQGFNADAIEAAYAGSDGDVIWPAGTYILDRTVTISLRHGTTYFNGVTIKADSDGSFTEIQDTHEVGIGKYVLWNNRDNAYHSYVGSVEFNGNDIPDLVAIGTHRRGEANGEGGRASTWDKVSFVRCAYALYGQANGGNGSTGPGGFSASYTGSVFNVFRVFPNCEVAFEFYDNQGDDIFFNSAQLINTGTNIIDHSHLSFGSLYMRGSSLSQTMLRLYQATVFCATLYIEFKFYAGIDMQLQSVLTTPCLKVGAGVPTNFTTAPIHISGIKVHCEITEHFKNQNAQATIPAIIHCLQVGNARRNIIVKRNYGRTEGNPAVEFSSNLFNFTDLIQLYAGGVEWVGFDDSGSLGWKQVAP